MNNKDLQNLTEAYQRVIKESKIYSEFNVSVDEVEYTILYTAQGPTGFEIEKIFVDGYSDYVIFDKKDPQKDDYNKLNDYGKKIYHHAEEEINDYRAEQDERSEEEIASDEEEWHNPWYR